MNHVQAMVSTAGSDNMPTDVKIAEKKATRRTLLHINNVKLKIFLNAMETVSSTLMDTPRHRMSTEHLFF